MAALLPAPAEWDVAGRDLVRRTTPESAFHALAVVTDLAWTPALAPLSVLAIAALLLSGRRADALRFAATMIGAIALTVLFKVVLDRPRPPPMLRTMGFPSGHVVVGACFYLGLARCIPRTWPRARGLALVVATALLSVVTASRLVLGNHYPSDVAGGLALAALVLWAARRRFVLSRPSSSACS